ncbi:MAG TPA: hypothetical protein PKL46_04620 [Aquabacterium sp.]|nr:hypothetical protein [Aquabacterium sp.]
MAPTLAMAAADADAVERERITAERRAVEARFDAARRDCEARFVVTDCLAAARALRREALAPLQQQLHMLDDARRRQRAVERLEAIRARESAAAARPALEAPAPAASTAAPAQPPARRAARTGAPPASAAQQQAQDRAAQQGRRLQQAREHEEAVKARNARRDAHRPPAAGLPVPAASASAP